MNCERPTSNDELEAIVRQAYRLACKEQYADALEICNWLIEEESTAIAGYRQRAAVKEHMRDVNGAIQDLTVVTSRFAHEPADFHALGILLLQNGNTLDAIAAFGTAINLGKSSGNNYYSNSSLLFRSEAFLKRDDLEDAINEVTGLPNGYGTYISGTGMRTRENILDDATAALKRKSKNKFRPK